MNNNKPKSKPMTAFRFAAANNIPIRYYEGYIFDRHYSLLGMMTINYTIDINNSAIAINHRTDRTAIAISKHSSQLIKECSIWHELGHWVEYKNLGANKVKTFSILKKEARASMIAIRLMKMYGRYKTANKADLLNSYNSYKCNRPHATCYRHLIEEA